MDFSRELAGNIRAVRARADLSQAEVASKLGVNVSIFAKTRAAITFLEPTNSWLSRKFLVVRPTT